MSVFIDVSAAHFWDISAVGVLDKAVIKLQHEGKSVRIVGLNEASADLIERFAIHDGAAATSAPSGH